MARRLRAAVLTMAVVALAVFMAPSPAQAAVCTVNVYPPYHYGHTIYGGGNVNGCNQGPYKIQLSRVYWWGLAPYAHSPEFIDGGGSVASFNCTPGGVYTYRVTVQKYSGWFGIYDDWVHGPDRRITC